jgi:hypothetical protein
MMGLDVLDQDLRDFRALLERWRGRRGDLDREARRLRRDIDENLRTVRSYLERQPIDDVKDVLMVLVAAERRIDEMADTVTRLVSAEPLIECLRVLVKDRP